MPLPGQKLVRNLFEELRKKLLSAALGECSDTLDPGRISPLIPRRRGTPRRRDAEKDVLSLRAKINSGVRSPESMDDLVTHYTKHELTLERKAFATVDAHAVYIKTM
jgi:hypothetical protein